MHVPREKCIPRSWITNEANVFANMPLRDDPALALATSRNNIIRMRARARASISYSREKHAKLREAVMSPVISAKRELNPSARFY